MKFRHAMLMVGVLSFASLAFAQRPGGGMGRPAGAGAPGGMGPSTVGAPSGMGRGSAGNMGAGEMGRSPDVGSRSSRGMEPQSPTTLLQNNSKLNTALTNALGKSGVSVPGGNLETACSGFKNLGQCIAALHVAKNLDLPGGFDALKDKMTGKGAVNLGKAIHELNPDVKAKAESKKAAKQAKKDIKSARAQSS